MFTHLMTSPRVATFTREAGSPPLGINHARLPLVAPGIGGSQDFQGFLRRFTCSHELKTLGSVGGIGVGLGRHRAHTRLGPGHYRAHPKKFTLHGNPQVTGDRIKGND